MAIELISLTGGIADQPDNEDPSSTAGATFLHFIHPAYGINDLSNRPAKQIRGKARVMPIYYPLINGATAYAPLIFIGVTDPRSVLTPARLFCPRIH